MPQIDISKYPLGRNRRSSFDGDDEIDTIDGEAIDVTDQCRARGNGDEDDDSPSTLPIRYGYGVDNHNKAGQAEEDKTPRLPFGPLRHLNPDKIESKSQLMEQLIQMLPLNDFDMPIYVYRPDLLDDQQIRSLLQADANTREVVDIQSAQEALNAAILHLEYPEGFPILPDGSPFWAQLTWEPQDAYDAFIEYIELGGARQIHKLHSYPIEQVREWFHLYYWNHRVQCFDLYRIANHQRTRLQRMLVVEEDHYQTASKVMAKLKGFIENIQFDETNLTPEKAVGVLEKLVKIQRLSVGLPAQGGTSLDEQVRQPQQTTVILQNVTESSRTQEKPKSDGVDVLMEDPDSIELVQQLVIKLQGKTS